MTSYNILISPLPYFRMNDVTYTFMKTNLLGMFESNYDEVFDSSNVEFTYKLLCSGGNRIQTRKRNLVMYQYGSTIGPSRWPRYLFTYNPDNKHMLPRPVVKSRPGQLGHTIMKTCSWLRKLCKDIEYLTIKHLQTQKNQTSDNLLEMIRFCKKEIPSSLRICNTFFTQMIIVGCYKTNGGFIPLHMDNDDHITSLLSLGRGVDKSEGCTFYVQKKPQMIHQKVVVH